jgi:pseudouridylate synthase
MTSRSAPASMFRVSERVAKAIAAGRAVVALETTVVTHGLPHPRGLEVAAAIERVVRGAGAEPATIGVLDGVVRVGLGPKELERIATSPGVPKLNLSNLAAYVAAGGPGSTTVAATMLAASRVGIKVFATGGIGGVHRDVADTLDVSADLVALARFPVAVVCAGAKAVLDLPKTIELLETLGVPVLGYRTDAFPAFYRRDSGLAVDRRFEALADLARAIRAHHTLGVGGGVIVANPVPAENELPRELYDRALATALADAGRAGIVGRGVTPFLLDRVRDLTEGQSVFSNRALLEHNAKVAGELAVEMASTR